MKSTIIKMRLAYIEALIVTRNKVNRKDLTAMFKIQIAAAGRDFARYHKLYPDNIVYDIVNRHHKATPTFEQKALKDNSVLFLTNLNTLKDYF